MGCNVPFLSNSWYNQEKLHRGINSLSLDFFFSYRVLYQYIGEGNGTPLQYSCLENPMYGGAWWAAVYGVAQSQTRLKRLSSIMLWNKLSHFNSLEV